MRSSLTWYYSGLLVPRCPSLIPRWVSIFLKQNQTRHYQRPTPVQWFYFCQPSTGIMRFSATQWIQHLPVQNMDLGKCEVYGSALMFLNLYFLTCFVWIVLVFRTVKELGSYVLRTIKGGNIPLKLNVQEQIFTCYQCAGANKMLSVQSSTGERRVLVCWERNAPKRTTGSHLFFFLDQTIFSLVLDNTGLNWWCYLRMHLC